MRLLRLTVENLGVFRGHHEFDFRPLPSTEEGLARNLTIVRGENGAGKSTLFKALGLALHGPLSLGNRVTHQAYNDFLLNRLHRRKEESGTAVCDEGGVNLTFGYVRSGRPVELEVSRRWARSGKKVVESLDLRCDGEEPDVDPADYQSYLNDLVPPGLAPLCFFDAEFLDALTLPERRGGALLGETVRRLLGLDLVERLQADLNKYTVRQGGGRRVERLRKEVLAHQKAVEDLDAILTKHLSENDVLEQERESLEAALEMQEQRLAAEGGSYAARRPLLQERQTVVNAEIEALSEQMRDLSTGLLPFALVPGYCRVLSDNLTREAKAHRNKVAGDLLNERISALESSLQSDEVWRGLDVTAASREAATSRLIQLLRDASPSVSADGQPPVHRLAEPEHDRLQGWIAQALHSVPQQVGALGQRLRDLKKERRRIDEDLRRAPDDETLAPIHAEIERLQNELNEVQRRQKALDESLGALRFQHEEQVRQRRRADGELREAQAGERHTDLAERSKMALRSYQDALIRQRLAALEETLVESFNAVCHKEHLLGAVRLNPENFEVRLEGLNGRALSVEDFSAGERQLYALALLRALRRVSKRQLPLAVDTPVARLDETHRNRFVHSYVPDVSDQVLLFATDVEMDAQMLEQTEPYLARLYNLHHDEERGETLVSGSGARPAPLNDPVLLGSATEGRGRADF